MFNLVSLDSKTVLPVLLIVAAVGVAWWTFTKGNQQAAAASSQSSSDANTQNQLTSLAILEALMNPQSQGAAGASTKGLSTSQVTYTAPATSNQTGGVVVTQGAG